MFSNESRNLEMKNQLQDFMSTRKLPINTQNRLVSFYKYRYQDGYFREHIITSTLSDRLRKEINIHCSRRLIDSVIAFNDLPPNVLGDILENLQEETFLPNDIIMKAGSTATCMYFLAKGTVAVYTANGSEISHLQDGAYFGEIAMLMKDNKRITTVIALEICQVYKLSKRDFSRSFSTNPALYTKIERVANERLEEYVVLHNLYEKGLVGGSDVESIMN